MTRFLLLPTLLLLAACSTAQDDDSFALTAGEHALVRQGMVMQTIPDENPGPPFYARVTPVLNQFFVVDGQLVIPFYRDPACIPAGFNLLLLFDPPTGPDDPGAFACSLVLRGRLLTEADAPPDRFPKLVTLFGDAVPVWIVSWEAFQAAMQAGPVTIGVLEGLDPFKGTATRFHETLMPREGEHRIVIGAQGRLADGRSFRFHVTQIEDQAHALQLILR